MQIYKQNLSNFLASKKKIVVNLLNGSKNKNKIYDVFKDISEYVRYEYVIKSRFTTQKDNKIKLQTKIKELKSEIVKYKQILRLLRVKK